MSIQEQWLRAPWPIVDECFGHWDGRSRRRGPQGSCRQCDGSHVHQWVEWYGAPEVAPGTSNTGGMSGSGKPVRCADCGARKCDISACIWRRHHDGPHELL